MILCYIYYNKILYIILVNIKLLHIDRKEYNEVYISMYGVMEGEEEGVPRRDKGEANAQII